MHLSTHKSLADAVKFVRRDTVLDKLQLMRHPDALGHAAAAQALAALNPHGGEGGLLGKEEAQELQPAVAAAVELGIDVTGLSLLIRP